MSKQVLLFVLQQNSIVLHTKHEIEERNFSNENNESIHYLIKILKSLASMGTASVWLVFHVNDSISRYKLDFTVCSREIGSLEIILWLEYYIMNELINNEEKAYVCVRLMVFCIAFNRIFNNVFEMHIHGIFFNGSSNFNLRIRNVCLHLQSLAEDARLCSRNLYRDSKWNPKFEFLRFQDSFEYMHNIDSYQLMI